MRRMISQKLTDFIKGLMSRPLEWLLHNIKGSDSIVVDESEDGKNIVVDLDQDVKDAISGNNEMIITLTADDYNEDEDTYIKRVPFNNTFFKIVIDDETEGRAHDAQIFNPYFKGGVGADSYGPANLVGAEGIDSLPEERFMYFENVDGRFWMSLFNGVYSGLSTSF